MFLGPIMKSNSDHIEFIDVGIAIDNPNTTDGIASQDINFPTFEVGDCLIVMGNNFNGLLRPDDVIAWTELVAGGIPGNNLSAWWRVADGTGDDTFTMNAMSASVAGYAWIQSAVFRAQSGTIDVFQVGTVFAAPDDDWPIPLLAIGGEANNTMVITMYMKQQEALLPVVAISMDAPADGSPTVMGQHFSGISDGDAKYLAGGWAYEFQDVSVARALEDLTITPRAVANNSVRSFRFRLRSI